MTTHLNGEWDAEEVVDHNWGRPSMPMVVIEAMHHGPGSEICIEYRYHGASERCRVSHPSPTNEQMVWFDEAMANQNLGLPVPMPHFMVLQLREPA